MTRKTFQKIRVAIIVLVAAVSGVGGALNIGILILIAVPLGIASIMIVGRTVTDWVQDERLARLANAAARWTYAVFVLAASGTATVFVLVDRAGGSLWLAGMILTGAVVFQALVYTVLYVIFTKRY